jgi:gamma-glutamyltranspeptidase/glutathione hydrolase
VLADCATPDKVALVRQDSDGNWTLDDLAPLHAHAVTVPGAAAGWCDAVERWGSGRLSMADVLRPAIRLARQGFPVSPVTAHWWQMGERELRMGPHGAELMVQREGDLDVGGGGGGSSGSLDEGSGSGGIVTRAPRAGEVFRNPHLASVLERLCTQGKQGFYQGPVAEAVVEVLRGLGSVICLDDLAAHETLFPEAISASYNGVDLVECPPNGQGIIALLATNYLKVALEHPHYQPQRTTAPLSGEPSSHSSAAAAVPAAPAAGAAVTNTSGLRHNAGDYLHLVIEVLRMAFADGRMHVSDPSFAKVSAAELLSPDYARKRVAECFDPLKAHPDVLAGSPAMSCDTVSFQVVDAAGNAVSMVNSNYQGFGSGIVPRGCGFSLQNRGANFSLVPGHANALAGGKRPYHTILPALLLNTATRKLEATFTVMGGFMQPQGHLQMMLNMLDHGLSPQTALDAPRICLLANGTVAVEDGVSDDTIVDLRRRGHRVVVLSDHNRCIFGRGQVIAVRHDRLDPAGAEPPVRVLVGGSDGRADGCALAASSPPLKHVRE